MHVYIFRSYNIIRSVTTFLRTSLHEVDYFNEFQITVGPLVSYSKDCTCEYILYI